MKKSRQIISLLLSVLMITTLFTAVPFTANAAIASYGLYLGETEVTSENAADIFGDGKASYDNSTKTLTLDNPVIPGKAKDASGYTAKIYSALDELTIKGSYLMTASEAKYAVDAKQVIFDGNFSLYGSESGVYAYGIKFNGGRAYCWGKTGQGVQTTKVLGVYNGIQRVEFTSQFSSAVYYGKEFYKDYEVNVTTPANYSYGTHCILDGNNGNADATTVVLENPANGPKSGTTGDCTWEFDPGTGIMTISGSGEMEDYEWSNETQSTNTPWWDFRKQIKSVVIGDGVTAVGEVAFEKCANLTSLSLGKSVKEIKYDSFHGCALTSLEIPDSVETIGAAAFSQNSNLNNVSFGKNVKDIGGYAFYNDSGLTEVVLPDGVESVGYLAFGDNNDLKKVSIPASVTYIREYAFGYITPDEKIEGFTIYGYPDTAAQTYAEENGFIFVPLSGITGDCTWEFDPGTGIMTISGNGAMANYDWYGSTDSTNAPWWDFRNQIRSVAIGDGVTVVGINAFKKCENITSVEFPESLETIDDAAFFKCNLSEVILPDGVRIVGNIAFAENENIKKVTVPASVTYIGEYAFGYITSVEKIEGFTIYGQPDTAAQEYAEENGFIFVALEKKYDLWLGTTQVTSLNCDDILNDGGKAKFDPSTNTLTLNEPVITGYHTDSYNDTYVIYSDSGIENLTITGKCELESYSADYCVCNYGGSITLNGDFVFSGTEAAVCSGYDDVTISGGEISLYSDLYSCVACDTLTVTNNVKKLTINSNYEAIYASVGIQLGSEVAITKPDGGHIDHDDYGYGIYDKNGEYAKEVVIEKSAAPARKIGDVNNDGFIDVADATLIQKYAVKKVELTAEQLYVADVNNDGFVDVADATDIQKYAVKKITEFKKKA